MLWLFIWQMVIYRSTLLQLMQHVGTIDGLSYYETSLLKSTFEVHVFPHCGDSCDLMSEG